MSRRSKYLVTIAVLVNVAALVTLFWLVLDVRANTQRVPQQPVRIPAGILGRFVNPATATAITFREARDEMQHMQAEIDRLKRKTGDRGF